MKGNTVAPPPSTSSELKAPKDDLFRKLKENPTDENWTEFYNFYSRVAFGCARRRGLGIADSQDVVEETFGAIMRAIWEIKCATGEEFERWVIAVAHRKACSILRRYSRSKQLDLESLKWHEDAISYATRQECLAVFLALCAHLQKCATQSDYRAFSICILEEEGPERTAEMLNKSVHSVHVSVSKVRFLARGWQKSTLGERFF